MSPLAKEIIDKLNKEEGEPTKEEIKLYKDYKESSEEIIPLENLIEEL
jgi:hypothetical protein